MITAIQRGDSWRRVIHSACGLAVTFVQKPCATKTSSRRLTPSATLSSVAAPAGSGAGASKRVAYGASKDSIQFLTSLWGASLRRQDFTSRKVAMHRCGSRCSS